MLKFGCRNNLVVEKSPVRKNLQGLYTLQAPIKKSIFINILSVLLFADFWFE